MKTGYTNKPAKTWVRRTNGFYVSVGDGWAIHNFAISRTRPWGLYDGDGIHRGNFTSLISAKHAADRLTRDDATADLFQSPQHQNA